MDSSEHATPVLAAEKPIHNGSIDQAKGPDPGESAAILPRNGRRPDGAGAFSILSTYSVD
jgi:hypothetical protein